MQIIFNNGDSLQIANDHIDIVRLEYVSTGIFVHKQLNAFNMRLLITLPTTTEDLSNTVQLADQPNITATRTPSIDELLNLLSHNDITCIQPQKSGPDFYTNWFLSKPDDDTQYTNYFSQVTIKHDVIIIDINPSNYPITKPFPEPHGWETKEGEIIYTQEQVQDYNRRYNNNLNIYDALYTLEQLQHHNLF